MIAQILLQDQACEQPNIVGLALFSAVLILVVLGLTRIVTRHKRNA